MASLLRRLPLRQCIRRLIYTSSHSRLHTNANVTVRMMRINKRVSSGYGARRLSHSSRVLHHTTLRALSSPFRLTQYFPMRSFSSQVNSVSELLDEVTRRDPHQKEFLTAVTEVVNSMKTQLEGSKSSLEVMRRICEPERAVSVRRVVDFYPIHKDRMK